jgi:Fe2+ transport system protein FeoA
MSMGLGIGHELELLRLSPLGGPLLVLRGETKVAIGYGMAKKILVEKSG